VYIACVSLIISSSNFESKGFNAHVGNLSSPHARRRLIGCVNFKGYVVLKKSRAMLMEEGKMKTSSHCWWIVLANDEYKHLLEYVEFYFTQANA
jgi:hypothetical protein